MVLKPDATGTLDIAEVELNTVDDIVTLKGVAASFLGGTRLSIDPNDPLQLVNGGLVFMSDEQRYEAIVKDKGTDVRAHYVVNNGVLWPEDFHTWDMVSLYYNFERAYGYYFELDRTKEPKELQRVPVHYWANFKLNGTQVTDNMLYLSLIKSFVVAPLATNDARPLPMNIGVVGHEMAHRLFNVRALQGAGLPSPLVEWALEPFNLLKSLDEGLADFHGFSVTCREVSGCNPKFLDSSIADSATRKIRDVSRIDACLDSTTRQALASFDQTKWITSPEMYKVGNIIASSLYQAGNKAGRIDGVQRGLLAALDDDTIGNLGLRQLINTGQPALFTLENVADVIAGHMPDDELKKQVCQEFSARLNLKCASWPCTVDGADLMTHCPASARRDTTLCNQP